MKLWKQLCYIFPPKQRWKFVGLFFLQLIETILDFCSVSLILPFVNILVNAESLRGSWWYLAIVRFTGAEQTSSVLLFLTFLMMAVYVLKNCYILFVTNLRMRFLCANQIKMGTKMILCYMYKPYTFHLQRNTAEIVRNVNTDVSGAFAVISNLLQLISDALIVSFLVVYLFAVDVWLTLGVLAALGLCSVVYFLLVRRKIRTVGKESRTFYAKMIQAVQQSMGGIKEVKVMGREKFFADAYMESGTQFVRHRKTYAVLAAIPGRMIETLCMCSVFAVIAIKLIQGTNLEVLVPSLSAFAVAAIRLMPKANSINSCINEITFNLPSLESLYDDLVQSDRQRAQWERETAEKNKKGAVSRNTGAEPADIVLQNISYTYPNAEQPVLQGVDLTIRHGTSVGIIGTTGAGKTTLVDIILGVLTPQTGTICYGALDIHADYAAWQKHIGYIPQSIYLMDDTIRNNVALGVAGEQISDSAVWNALESAQLAGFVRGLPQGLDTVIGESGVRLSGGQRQRIGIARALYRDPEILFFDEATSSLDNETEAAVMEAINTLGSSKTMIIVAHRLSTIRECDYIYRVENMGISSTTLEE